MIDVDLGLRDSPNERVPVGIGREVEYGIPYGIFRRVYETAAVDVDVTRRFREITWDGRGL